MQYKFVERAKASQVNWPFKLMKVGDIVEITGKHQKEVQGAVHSYAYKTKKKFTTSSVGDAVYVTRVK